MLVRSLDENAGPSGANIIACKTSRGAGGKNGLVPRGLSERVTQISSPKGGKNLASRRMALGNISNHVSLSGRDHAHVAAKVADTHTTECSISAPVITNTSTVDEIDTMHRIGQPSAPPTLDSGASVLHELVLDYCRFRPSGCILKPLSESADLFSHPCVLEPQEEAELPLMPMLQACDTASQHPNGTLAFGLEVDVETLQRLPTQAEDTVRDGPDRSTLSELDDTGCNRYR